MTGLILEGGGMRGLYTAGVLDYFLDQKLDFLYAIGVSAGACNMASYFSGQRDRSRRVNVDFVNDKRYMSWKNFLFSGSMFSEEMMFDRIPRECIPFDYEAYAAHPGKKLACVTSCLTGKALFLPVEDFNKDYNPVLASMSLPLVSKVVRYKGDELLDGGIADPIPVRKALSDGCEKLVVVLTREEGYLKKPESTLKLAKTIYRHYPKLIKALKYRHLVYNETLAYIRQLEQEGKAFVIRPSQPVHISRIEKDTGKLNGLYHQGYADSARLGDKLKEFLAR